MNPAKTRKSKIIIQYTKIFDLSTCTLTPQRFREACFLTKRRQVVQNHPTLEGCLLFIQKKQLLNARHPLKCWAMRLSKSQDHHLTHWVLLTFSEGGRGWIRNQTYHADYHEPTESTPVRERRNDISEKVTFDLTAGHTGQGDKPLSQVKLTWFPALHQLFLFPPSLHRSHVLMAVAVTPRWLSHEIEWIQMKRKRFSLHIWEDQGGWNYHHQGVWLSSPRSSCSSAVLGLGIVDEVCTRWNAEAGARGTYDHSLSQGSFELMSVLELAWGVVVWTRNLPSIIVSTGHHPTDPFILVVRLFLGSDIYSPCWRFYTEVSYSTVQD